MMLVDFMQQHPQLAQEWDFAANAAISPENLAAGSEKKVMWRCAQGHSWQASVYSRTKLGHGCPYCAGQRPIVGETDLQTKNPAAAKLWDAEKNAPLTPADVMPGSHKKVWWRCKHNHCWHTSIYSVAVMGTGCPYCKRRQAMPQQTDIHSEVPHLAEEWSAELNTVDPQQILQGSTQKIWWRCKLGHIWQAAVYSRTGKQNNGCPYCANKKVLAGFNDLATVCPQVARQWYAPLNAPLTPQQVTRGSKKKVWWQCDEGHVWQAAVFSRTRAKPSGCPVCAGVARQRPRQFTPQTQLRKEQVL